MWPYVWAILGQSAPFHTPALMLKLVQMCRKYGTLYSCISNKPSKEFEEYASKESNWTEQKPIEYWCLSYIGGMAGIEW
jgi:hypothetical protein